MTWRHGGARVLKVPVSVIIPAHNAAETLGRQLAALARQLDTPAFEVVVVLNRCVDATGEVASSFAEQLDVSVVVADDLASAAYARNVGVAHSRGRLLLFCDADDEAGPSWVSAMSAPLDRGDADFVGGMIRVERQGLPDWLYQWRYERLDGLCLSDIEGWLPFALSASLGVTRRAFESVGGFDERFPGAACEEIDLQRRLLRAGWRAGVATEAEMRYVPRTDPAAVVAQSRTYHRGLRLLNEIEGHPTVRPSYGMLLRDLPRIAAHCLVKSEHRSPRYLYYRTRVEFARWLEGRRHGVSAHSIGHLPTAVDFAVPVDTPRVGGLAFEVADRTHWLACESRAAQDAMIVRELESLMPPGGVFVDVGAGVGIVAVAAARIAGPAGRVIAVEDDPRWRPLLERNLERHALTDGVAIIDQVDWGVLAEADLVRVCARSVPRMVSGLDPSTWELRSVRSGSESPTDVLAVRRRA